MSEQISQKPPDQHKVPDMLHTLKEAFPLLDSVPLAEDITTSPSLSKLSRLIQLSIPVSAYPPEPLSLYKQISSCYYSHFFKQSGNREPKAIERPLEQVQILDDVHQLSEVVEPNVERTTKVKSKINHLQFAKYINNFSADQEVDVSQELIQMGRVFDSWKVKEVNAPEFFKFKNFKQESKAKQTEIKKKQQKQKESSNNDVVKIILGKNFSMEYKEMRDEILSRAKNNKLLEENTRMTQIEKITTEINYILNRITEQFFDEFLQELIPYAQDEIYSIILSDKILEKVMEEHNFIAIYSKLVKKLKRVNVLIGGDKELRFKNIFVQRLQQTFYNLIRQGQWQDKEEYYKKRLLGMNQFIGQLMQIRYLSKYIFCDCFYELVRGYVAHYNKHKDNKSIFFYETYVECIIKIIEKMGQHYDHLLKKKNHTDIDEVIKIIIDSCDKEEQHFEQICDFMEILKILNKKLPSNRSKITFLLQDFRCSKHLQKQKQNINNLQYQIIQQILSIDIEKEESIKKVPKMISKCHPETLMKDYLFQFAQGTVKQVNKNIEMFRYLSECPGICDATVSAFRQNTEGLFLIQSDFPFMSQGIAKIMKTVCDKKKINFQELNLGDFDQEDEDIRWFLENIEGKYFKMIMQD